MNPFVMSGDIYGEIGRQHRREGHILHVVLYISLRYMRLCLQNGWCVEFQTSEITAFRGEERLASNKLDYFLLDVRRHITHTIYFYAASACIL